MAIGYLFPNESSTHVLWGLLIVLYPFMTCSIFGSLFTSSLPSLFGRKTVSPLSRLALAISVSFIPFAFFPILFDIGQPFRAFNIMITPRFSSPMAVFGFVFSFVAGVIILQAWLTFREDLVENWRKKRGVLQILYAVCSLGMNNMTPQAKKIDRGFIKLLQVVGLAAAAILPGYVAFDFSTCPGNPWWNSSIRPVIFLITGIVNGAALTLFFSFFYKPRSIPDDAVKTLLRFLAGSLVAVAVLSILEISVFLYSEGYGAHVTELLLAEGGPLRPWFFLLQLGLGTALPLALVVFALLFRLRGTGLKLFGAAAGLCGLLQTFALLWNSVIGGQSVSKGFTGVIHYEPELLGLKGIVTAIVIVGLPAVLLFVINLIVPLVKNGGKTDSTETASSAAS